MQTQAGFSESGYVTSEDDVANKATTINWYGPRTGLLGRIVAEGARRGIRVSVQTSRWSIGQLHAAIEAIWKQTQSGDWDGLKLAAVAAPVGVSDPITVYDSYTSSSGGSVTRAATPSFPP